MQRLATSNISSASRFADRSTAESAVSAAVNANQATIQSYLTSNTQGYLAVEYTSSTPVGVNLA
ncbi:RNase A-like domain-containing protein [Pseudomonas brassicacearum]|uniref:RNase A-like domain-containing protein n=1 Tax=Pseudomonas brassicacearum TaxID=930166 RepID=UPI0038621C83